MKKPPAMVMQFIHMEGPLKGQIQEFRQPEIFIGRSPTCQICFPKDLAIVSRVHARIVREGNRFMLMDQSTNGSFVNGKQVKEAILKDGDILLFAEGGPKVSFLTQTMEEPEEVVQLLQPGALSAPIAPAPLPHASPPPAPERPAGVPQPASARPDSPLPPPKLPISESSPAQFSSDMPIQQVKKPLVVQYGPTLQSYNVLPVMIGRGAQCDFRIDHPAVFERHAQIYYHQEHYWIKDLTGKNLVRINGRCVEEQGMLEPDHRLSLSEQGPEFRFLGGGRLAEIEAAVAEESPRLPRPEGGDTGPGVSQGNAVKQIGAMMKKILKR